nr:putative integron gene cassette protein [uncultured bacterium]
MVDHEARTQLAESVRHLVAGRITNDDFEDGVPYSKADPAIGEVFFDGAWNLYSDLHEHKLVGRYRLPDSSRPEVARWILFLKTDLEYEWKVLHGLNWLAFPFGNLLTLGLLGVFLRRRWAKGGDVSVWPFYRESDFKTALNQHPYLAGKTATAP